VESRFSWLESKDTPDGRGRRRGDPLYDSRTVSIPEQFYNKLSGMCAARKQPVADILHFELYTLKYNNRTDTRRLRWAAASQQQYWAIKKKYRDVVLFFKVGGCLALTPWLKEPIQLCVQKLKFSKALVLPVVLT